MKRKLTVLFLAFALVGCSGGDNDKDDSKSIVTEPVAAGEYRIITPFESSDTRQTHVEFNRGAYDREAVGKGLMEYSKEHFSPDTYYVQEGKVLNRDQLQVGTTLDDKRGVLGFKTSENTNGLNPQVDSKIPINDSTTIISGDGQQNAQGKPTGRTIPISDVFEIDFMTDTNKDSEIEGLAFAIVLNPTVKDKDNNEHTIEDAQLRNLGAEAARQLVSYLRTRPEVGNNKPIFICLFNASSLDDTLPGRFIASGYGKDNIDSFSDINEKWVIFPSEPATSLDSVVSSQFVSIKDSLSHLIPNDIGVIGRGKFVDDSLKVLKINIDAQAKTHTECLALVQYTNELLGNIESDAVEITVRFNANGETFAMIKREVGSKATNVTMY